MGDGPFAASRHENAKPQAGLGLARPILGFANGALLSQFRTTAGLAGLLVVFPLAKFFLNAAALKQLLEPPQSQTDRLSFVDAHPKGHTFS
jgi:hypothetical protein